MIKNGQTIAVADYAIVTTAGEALSARDAVYIKSSDGKAYKCDADDLTTMDFAGFAQEAASLNAAVNVIQEGLATGFSSLTIGARYYISGTAGAITTTAPSNVKNVGVAISATVIRMDKFPTHRIVAFTASGTWTKRAGLKYVRIRLVGAGGAGGGEGSNDGSGGGGGGGGYSEKIIPAQTLGSTETVTIGAGGTGVSQADGNAGGTTSFGSHSSATGGSGGGANNTTNGKGGDGGIGSSGDINSRGDGGSGGHLDLGSDTTALPGGKGGSSLLGGGMASGGSNVGYGGGGAGAGNNSGGAGSTGSDGSCFVDEFY